ncbi:hypothetical protein ABVK25_010280 [Lepraria finkii]|uniref:F-box domain-containing protein n=1 Tax=Lepraria finkii TaxID=1340010 RepID=A0ABR4AW15_9LECA
MDQLPQELLRIIANDDSLSREDLHHLRLVNRPLAAASAPPLFHTSLWLGLSGLKRLTCISEHPQLCQYVEEIIFSPLRIQESSSPTEHQYEDQKWMLRQYGSIISYLLSLGKHMTAYKTYVGAQRYLSTNDLDIKTLSRAFSNLSQLETFCLDGWNCHTGSRELSGAFGYSRCDQLLTADGKYVLPVDIRALSRSRIKVKVFELGRNFHDEIGGHDLWHAHYLSSLSASDRESVSYYTKDRLTAIYLRGYLQAH